MQHYYSRKMNKNLKIELKDATVTAVYSTAFIHALEPNFLYFLDENICVHIRSFKTIIRFLNLSVSVVLSSVLALKLC